MDSSFLKLLAYINGLLWLIPIIRQRNTKHSVFFFFYGIPDAIQLLLKLLFHIKFNSHIYAFFTTLLLPSIFGFGSNRKKLFWMFFAAAAAAIVYFLPWRAGIIYNIIIIIIILFYFCKDLFHNALTRGKLSLFTLLIIFVCLLTVLKMILVIQNPVTSLPYYIITSIFQLFIAIIFSIFTPDHKWMTIRLVKDGLIEENSD